MAKLIVELTNRCNLNCQHCFSGRHGGSNDLALPVLEKALLSARKYDFNSVAFTGGEVTVYPHFSSALHLAYTTGYRFGCVTNGQNFSKVYSNFLPYRDKLSVITFSLDGATEITHDRLRGKGTFRRVMQALSICVAEDLPFTLNMVVTAHNHHEIETMVQLAPRLGSQGLRFGHLLPSQLTTSQGFDLSPWEHKQIEARIWQLREQSPIPIAIASGYYTTSLFPCGPLQMQEINIDCHGNLTKCCHLSSHGDGAGQGDVIGNLNVMSFDDAYNQLLQENERFRHNKLDHLSGGTFQDADSFPCWYCLNHYEKVEWLRTLPDHPWSSLMRKKQVADQGMSSTARHILHPIMLEEGL
jgi:MoaA/NifB/PqqE/SkfB family radical SAM enzyme